MTDRMEESPCELTKGLVAGDELAWRSFHARYYPLLIAQAVARGICAGEAPEIVQGVYLRVLRHVKVFQREADLEAWLACLTRCEVIDAVRRVKRRTWLSECFQQWQEFRRCPSHPDLGDLELAMEALEEPERRLLTRHYLEGWSQEELAAEQQTTPKAVESKLARIRRKLRGEIENLKTCDA